MFNIKQDPLGDGISSVEYIDHMGDDLRVVNSARVSMNKESNDLTEADEKLIKYLSEHRHFTPFTQPQICARIKMPIFLARQYFKHQIGFSRNEVSRRYVSTMPEFFFPRSWRLKAENVKQGSSSEKLEGVDKQEIDDLYKASVESAKHCYALMLKRGVCPEQARMVLPQSMYTEFIETGSLAAYARMVGLRDESHAQQEIQLYAKSVGAMMAHLFKVSWKQLTRKK